MNDDRWTRFSLVQIIYFSIFETKLKIKLIIVTVKPKKIIRVKVAIFC